MEAITSTRIGQIRWNKGYVAFILHFLDFFRQYEDITPDSEWFPDSMKLMFLQNAVEGVSHLDSINTQFCLIHESSGQGPEFNQYSSLLLAAATDLDNRNSHGRRVNTHEILHTEQERCSTSAWYAPLQEWDIFDRNNIH